MIVVLDTETTGLGEEDQVIELAVVWLSEDDPEQERYKYSFLIRPTVPITPGARAAHHVTDAELAGKWPPQRHPVQLLLPPDAVVVAHNLEFDARMLLQTWPRLVLPSRRLCTWRASLHVWPDEDSHSNQALRYSRGLSVPGADGLPAHRALADALVTSALLRDMLRERSLGELVELSSQPALIKNVRFGKYRGQRWADMDSGYLRWVLSKNFDDDVMHTARYWLERRG